VNKGDQTRTAILDQAFNVAATLGLEALSIGRLAKQVGLSKSGLFAHFKSKEALQIQVLEHARDDFVQCVVAPGLQAARGEPRVRALFERWLTWGIETERQGGCVFLQSAAEFDDRPGGVRDCLVRSQKDWTEALVKAAEIGIEEGHFRNDLNPRQFAFEFYGLMMSAHFHHRLLEQPDTLERTRAGFERLLDSSR
jgi:AcrR family transcriptional regulator